MGKDMKQIRRKKQKILWAWMMTLSLFTGVFSGTAGVDAAENTVLEQGMEGTPAESQSPVESAEPVETGVPEVVPGTEAPPAAETEEPVWSAEPEVPEQASFRIMFTSDIHGQVTTEDYETGRSNYTTGGYSKTVSLIQAARQESGENSVLFDLGDNLYDYTTDYIYEYDSSAEQPIYTALSKMNYDAITLGNHEFEYTLGYLKDQLERTGLTDKVVLSNVWDAVTKEHVWAENKILTKKIISESGKELEIKVGLIGETPPKLSKKKTDFTGILESEDIIENVKKEAEILKEQGADLVIVLGHTGIGGENPEKKDDDTGYALTKLSDVDAVLCGHKHRDFPLRGRSTIYDTLPGIDPETKLVNGKPLVQVQNRGASLGIADLRLEICGGRVQVLGGRTEVREVDENTPVNQEINECEGKWAKIFMSDCSEIVCDISADADVQNYFGPIEDTDAIQLLNNIKISCALQQKKSKLTKYQDLPVVAASTYFRSGLEDDNDYIDIRAYFKRSNIYNLVKYKTRLELYCMTGAQLKEWLEWAVSGYEEQGKGVLLSSVFSSEKTLSDKPLQYALTSDTMNNWSTLYLFDGVSYTVDTMIPPRYNSSGVQVSDTSRIVSMSRNGVAVQPEDTFLVITDALPSNALFQGMNPNRVAKYSSADYRVFVEEYLRQLSRTGGLKSSADQNWRVKFSDASAYVLKSSVNAEDFLSRKPWIIGKFGKVENVQYYLADFSRMNMEDTAGPSINTAVLNQKATNKAVEVSVQVTDESGLQSVRYVSGKYIADSEIWNTEAAKQLKESDSFLCDKNGIYTIYAVDTRGNRQIEYVEISNINSGVLGAPVVDSFSNRKTKLTGTAEPNATIYFWLENGKTYTTKVKSTGKFSKKIPAQKAGTTIYAYAADSQGRASARTVIVVQRTGPNKPTLDGVTTESKVVSGTIGDTYAYPVLFVGDNDVYVSNANVKGLFQKSSLYSDSQNIFICPMDMKENGTFSMTLPNYVPAESLVELRTVDVAYRLSLGDSKTCELKAPNKPVEVSGVTNLTRTVKVYSEQPCDSAVVSIGNENYSEESSSYDGARKRYCFEVSIPRTDSGYTLSVYLTNEKGSSGKITIRPKKVVPDTPKVTFVKAGKKKIVGQVDLVGPTPAPDAEDIEVKKTVTEKVKVKKKVKGKTKTIVKTKKKTVVVTIPAIVTSTKTKVFVYVNGKKKKAEITSKGKFYLILNQPLKKGTKIICQAQNAEGSSLKLHFTP